MKIPKCGAFAIVIATTTLAISAGGAPAKVNPEAYNTWDGSGSFTGDSIVGPSTCGLSNLVARARSIRDGADVEVRTFDAACTGVITEAEQDGSIRFRIRRGAMTGKIAVVITNKFNGVCRYAGPVTGSVRKGGNTVSGAGTVTLQATLAPPCAPDSKATMKVKFPGAQFNW